MFGTAPNRDDVSVLANGAVENSEYDLRKQMNAHTRNEHTQRFLNLIYNLVALCVVLCSEICSYLGFYSGTPFFQITKNTALLVLTSLQKSRKGLSNLNSTDTKISTNNIFCS